MAGRSVTALAMLTVLAPLPACCRTWYVSVLGSDANSGRARGAPLQHLQTAAGKLRPGDVVMVMDGTYTAGPAHDVLDITVSGTPRAWITWRAAPGAHPVIRFTGAWAGMQIDAAYIIVEGFEFAGGAQQISLAYAEQNAGNLNNVLTTATAISIDNYITGATPHHITIQNNVVHDAPGAGIGTMFADYITITGNVVYRNAHWSAYANSGISLWEMHDIDHNTGIKNMITRNVSYRNQEFIPNQASGVITDGNGIIIDDNKNTQSGGTPYAGRTYVADNIVYLNGGSGIHAFSSAHVDIINNTAYLNNQSPSIDEGQVFADYSSDSYVLNNIGYAPPGKVFYSDWGNDGTVHVNYNLLYSTTPKSGLGGAPLGGTDIVGNPLFVDRALFDFRVRSGSPAIGTGTTTLAPPTDFAGHAPAPGMGITRGAFEFQ
jgi:hypothetical protein